ncbi:hypothetical protein HDV05_003622 [Chytridiales sp. JEL 0842]|nr:hypothetical protein HDV05_003622 [Chytridiales sp. JEL 0842]
MPRQKFLTVGDERCGKTALLQTYTHHPFPLHHQTTVSESYIANPFSDNPDQEVELVDTPGSEEFDRLRPMAYDGVEVWLVCFSIESRRSLVNVVDKWIPEVRYFNSSIPVILVGCKADLRSDPETLERLSKAGEKPVSIEMAREVARKIGAFKYVETSAKTGFQVSTMFEDDVDDLGDSEDEEPQEQPDQLIPDETMTPTSSTHPSKRSSFIGSEIQTKRLSLEGIPLDLFEKRPSISTDSNNKRSSILRVNTVTNSLGPAYNTMRNRQNSDSSVSINSSILSKHEIRNPTPSMATAPKSPTVVELNERRSISLKSSLRTPTDSKSARSNIMSPPSRLSMDPSSSRRPLPSPKTEHAAAAPVIDLAPIPTAEHIQRNVKKEEEKILPKDEYADKREMSKRKEFDKIEKALKDEKFRSMFMDYVKEISDPANKAKYEAEIEALERERGNDIKWIKPTPSFVVKTSYKERSKGVSKDIEKVFVNVCSSPEVSEAKSKVEERKGKRGEAWEVPYSLTQGREDVDKSNNKCMVYDCVFNPSTLSKGHSQPAFLNLLIETALEGIERQFEGIKLSREYKRMKHMKCKGEIKATVVRTPTNNNASEKREETTTEYLEKIQQLATQASKPSKRPEAPSKKEALIQELPTIPTSNPKIKTPTYTLLHSSTLTPQNFLNTRTSNSNASRPENLIIKISLPELTSAAAVDLDVQETYLELKVEGKYELKVPFQFPVDFENGDAKFDKTKRELVVRVPVQRGTMQSLPESEAPLEVDAPEEVQEPKVTKDEEIGVSKHPEIPSQSLEPTGKSASTPSIADPTLETASTLSIAQEPVTNESRETSKPLSETLPEPSQQEFELSKSIIGEPTPESTTNDLNTDSPEHVEPQPPKSFGWAPSNSIVEEIFPELSFEKDVDAENTMMEMNGSFESKVLDKVESVEEKRDIQREVPKSVEMNTPVPVIFEEVEEARIDFGVSENVPPAVESSNKNHNTPIQLVTPSIFEIDE